MELPVHLDLLLIFPPYSHGEKNMIEEFEYHLPPHGLMSIAAWVRSRGFSVRIIDCQMECPSVELFKEFFKKNYVEKKASIRHIGISSVTITIKKAFSIAAFCKTHYPSSPVIFGGAHPTVLPDEVLEQSAVDMVACGEGEITMEEILSGKPLSEIKGLSYKQQQEGKTYVNHNLPRERIHNLDELPLPAYDLVPILKYKPIEGMYRRLPAMNMITSRGCPNHCTFCSKTLGRGVSMKSPAKTFEEMRFLMKEYGIREIVFHDDTFTLNKKNVHALCDLIISSNTDILWTCFARVDTVDEELLRKMKKAGCHQIMFGIENFNEDILRKIKKNINPEQIKQAIYWAKKVGMDCRIAIIIGYPGETQKIIRENIRLAKKLKPDFIAINIATPYPGTELFDEVKRNQLLLSDDWDDYHQSNYIIKSENFSPEAMLKIYRASYRSFYFSAFYIIKKLMGVRSWFDLKVLMKGFINVIRFFVSKKI